MKYGLLILTSLILSINECNTSKQTKHSGMEVINIIDANYNNWTSGMIGSGSGVEYYLTLVAEKDSINIDSAFIGNEYIKTISKPKGGNQYYDIQQKTYLKDDTILVRASAKRHYKNSSTSNSQIQNYIIYYIGLDKKSLPIDTLIQIQNTDNQ
jgi:hypothetical protein